jgi:hypothetical protein
MKYTIEHVKCLGIGMEKSLEIVRCLMALDPLLKEILDSELNDGNHVQDAFMDWPDRGSVFVTLTDAFHMEYETGDSVKYTEPADPHYWTADYSCGNPVHVLAF